MNVNAVFEEFSLEEFSENIQLGYLCFALSPLWAALVLIAR